MFDHITIGTTDRDASERFYRTVLATLGQPVTGSDETYVQFGDFSLARAGDGRAVTTGLHVGFAAPSREHVDAFWKAGLDAGHPDDGAPGPRPEYRSDYYGAFLRDPDGNSAEAVFHGGLRQGGCIDHLWIRVADRDACRRFYAAVGEEIDVRAAEELPGRTLYTRGAGHGSFSLVDGEPTSPFHLAFGVDDRAAVQGFHAAALGARYADNGRPGERPDYGPGYYGAFVIDPAGHNVEAVHQ